MATTPGTYNIEIHDRTSLNITFTLNDSAGDPFDLSAYTVKAWATGDASALPGGVLDFAPTYATDGSNGQVLISMSVAETDVLGPTTPNNTTLNPNLGADTGVLWDMVITSASGVATKVLQGSVTIFETQSP